LIHFALTTIALTLHQDRLGPLMETNVRGIGCIFEMGRRRTAAEDAQTRAALFASKDGVALKIGQVGESNTRLGQK
jgi:hypothetical protein